MTSHAIYIDYAEDENEIYDDIMSSNTEDGGQFGDHVTDCTMPDIGDLPAILKPSEIKLEQESDDNERGQKLGEKMGEIRTTKGGNSTQQGLDYTSGVNTYRIESSNSAYSQSLITAGAASLSDSAISSNTVVEVNMSEEGKVANRDIQVSSEGSGGKISKQQDDREQTLVISSVKSLSTDT